MPRANGMSQRASGPNVAQIPLYKTRRGPHVCLSVYLSVCLCSPPMRRPGSGRARGLPWQTNGLRDGPEFCRIPTTNILRTCIHVRIEDGRPPSHLLWSSAPTAPLQGPLCAFLTESHLTALLAGGPICRGAGPYLPLLISSRPEKFIRVRGNSRLGPAPRQVPAGPPMRYPGPFFYCRLSRGLSMSAALSGSWGAGPNKSARVLPGYCCGGGSDWPLESPNLTAKAASPPPLNRGGSTVPAPVRRAVERPPGPAAAAPPCRTGTRSRLPRRPDHPRPRHRRRRLCVPRSSSPPRSRRRRGRARTVATIPQPPPPLPRSHSHHHHPAPAAAARPQQPHWGDHLAVAAAAVPLPRPPQPHRRRRRRPPPRGRRRRRPPPRGRGRPSAAAAATTPRRLRRAHPCCNNTRSFLMSPHLCLYPPPPHLATPASLCLRGAAFLLVAASGVVTLVSVCWGSVA